jgi:uncharacterized phage infection (PIP) family protein YhgE
MAMAASSSILKLMQIIQEGQAQTLDYLKRADERGERQSRATLKALAAIQDGLKVLHDGQKSLQDGQKVLHDGQKSLQDGQKVLHDGQRTLAQMLSDMQTITVRSLELTREIHETVIDKKSSRH